MAAAASPATTGSPAPAGRLPLTRGRVTALAVGIPVALVIVANTALSLLAPFAEGRYQVTYTAPVSTRTLTMNSSGGQVIAGPTEGAQATLTGTAHYSFIRSSFRTQVNGGDTAMNYHCAPLPTGDCGLDATIGVPAGLPVSVSTDGGNATVSSLSTPVTLHSAGGDLAASHMTGPLDLSTDGGNIQLTAISAPLTASTQGGDIGVTGISSATVTISTSGGNIQGTGVTSRNVTASTSGGDIEIVFTSVPRNVNVNTSGGNITLVLPPGTAQYNVNAHTNGGNVSDGLSRNSSSPNVITATSGGGDITLRQGLAAQQ